MAAPLEAVVRAKRDNYAILKLRNTRENVGVLLLPGDPAVVRDDQCIVIHSVAYDRATGSSASIGNQFVIKDGEVRWEPAIDATRLGLRGMLIPIVGMFVARSIVKTIFKHRRA